MRVFLIFLALFASLMAKDEFFGGEKKGKKEVAPVSNELYKKECASCHFGYQPGLLPKASWEHIMSTLDKHYGVDASLENSNVKALNEYILPNSAEYAQEYKRSAKITKSLRPGELYTSITQIPYIKKKHEDVNSWLEKNPKGIIAKKEVKTMANCSACHKKADNGVFSKKTVEIPTYGAWRD